MLSPTLNITHISTREVALTHYRSLVRFYTIRALFPTPHRPRWTIRKPSHEHSYNCGTITARRPHYHGCPLWRRHHRHEGRVRSRLGTRAWRRHRGAVPGCAQAAWWCCRPWSEAVLCRDPSGGHPWLPRPDHSSLDYRSVRGCTGSRLQDRGDRLRRSRARCDVPAVASRLPVPRSYARRPASRLACIQHDDCGCDRGYGTVRDSTGYAVGFPRRVRAWDVPTQVAIPTLRSPCTAEDAEDGRHLRAFRAHNSSGNPKPLQ